MRIPSARLALPVLVWAILYATHVLLGYYHDDYAYAGLTYFYTVEGPYSERLTLLNYVNYLYQHYMGWGGRIVAFGIAIPFMHAGPSVFWLVQSLLVTGILCFGASIVSRVTVREDFPQTLLFLLASYVHEDNTRSGRPLLGLCICALCLADVFPALGHFSHHAGTVAKKGYYPRRRVVFYRLCLFRAVFFVCVRVRRCASAGGYC